MGASISSPSAARRITLRFTGMKRSDGPKSKVQGPKSLELRHRTLDIGLWTLDYVGQLPVSHAQAQRPDHRRLFAGSGAVVLANPRVEAGLRPGRAAVGLHGDADLVYYAYAP